MYRWSKIRLERYFEDIYPINTGIFFFQKLILCKLQLMFSKFTHFTKEANNVVIAVIFYDKQ